MQPAPAMQALSLHSYNNDSPPFHGTTSKKPLEPVPALELDGQVVDTLSGQPAASHPAQVEATPRAVQSPPLPAWAPLASNSRPSTPNNYFAAPVASTKYPPISPSAYTDNGSVASMTRSTNGDIGPSGPMSAYTDLDRPSRIASPIDLKHEADNYAFPRHRLATQMQDESKIPLVIVACGSFSPPTYLHLRMFEMGKDAIDAEEKYEILGGYYSPVSDFYKKRGLAPAIHRVRMCELAVDQTSSWLMVDPWEASQPDYQRTAVVLTHFDEHLNGNGGLSLRDGSKKKIKILLLAGGDLIESFGEPGVWSDSDLHIILGRFGCLIIERTGSDVWAFLLSHDILYKHRKNVIVVKQLIYNDISSTKVRLFVKRGMSIKYLLPNSVIQYIFDHNLYADPKMVEPPLKSV